MLLLALSSGREERHEGPGVAAAEIPPQTVPQALGFADVEHFTAGVLHEVDARGLG